MQTALFHKGPGATVLALIGLCMFLGHGYAAESALVGKPAPAINLKLVKGGTFNLSEQRGKHVLILDFWATWCGPCRRAIPVLKDIAQQYAKKGVRYYAVNVGEDAGEIKSFLKEHKLDIRVPMDFKQKVADAYGVEAIPTMVVVDKKGVVRMYHEGLTDDLKTVLKRELDKVLAE